MKKIITLILILTVYPAFALRTIVNITPDDFIDSIYDTNKIVINETLYFLDTEFKLWQSNGDVLSTKKVSINGADVKVGVSFLSMIKFGDKLLFVNSTDNNTLWESDGINFNQLSDLEIANGAFPKLHKRNNKVYATVESQLLVIDEDSTTLVTIDNLSYINMDSLCVLDDNHYSFYGRETGASNKFYSFNNGSLEEITSDVIDLSRTFYRLNHKDSCLYRSASSDPDSEMHNGYSRYNGSGEFEVISNPNNQNIKTWEEAFTFNDKLYFTQYSVTGNYLYELADDSTQPIADVIAGCIFCYNVEISVTSDYLFLDTNIFSNNLNEPVLRTTIVFDKQLNEIASYTGNEVSPQFSTQDNQAVLLYKEDINKVVLTDTGLITASLKTPFINFIDIIGDGSQVFLFGNDRENKNKLALYKISNQLAISNQLDGLWINSEYKSQGLSIHTGVRPDDSQYIFVSFYIYRNGLPFWIAGSIDYSNGQSEISVDLFEYEGTSFVTSDNGLDDLTLSFGSMTIKPIGCDEIEIDIIINNEQPLMLPMARLSNNIKEDMCVE